LDDERKFYGKANGNDEYITRLVESENSRTRFARKIEKRKLIGERSFFQRRPLTLRF